MNKPTKRQQAIINLIPSCEVLCDVGCDHGVMGVTVRADKKAQKVIFVDISQLCLQKARNLALEHSLSNVEFICQNGLGDVICDCAIIAGMGGLEILDILDNAVSLPSRLILQPMRDVALVRQKLSAYYDFVVDKVVQDGKFYDIMYLQEGVCHLMEDEILFGRTNLQQPTADFSAYLERELRITEKILSQTSSKTKQQYKEAILRLQRGI